MKTGDIAIGPRFDNEYCWFYVFFGATDNVTVRLLMYTVDESPLKRIFRISYGFFDHDSERVPVFRKAIIEKIVNIQLDQIMLAKEGDIISSPEGFAEATLVAETFSV